MRLSIPLLLAAAAVTACKGEAPGRATSGLAPAEVASPPASVTPAVHLPPVTREGGTLVRAAAGDALYLADEDHGVVRRIPLPFDPEAPVLSIPMPGLPAQVVALADRVLVTVRSEGGAPLAAPEKSAVAPPKGARRRLPESPTGPGLLLILRPDAAAGLVEVGRVALPADAWGLAVTPDEKTALVSSAWTHQVSGVDLASGRKLWSISVPREPRAIVVRPDGASAYVTHLVGGALTRLDGLPGLPVARAVTLPPSPLRSPAGKTLDASLAYAATLSPDGARFFVARHALGALGETAWFGAATVDVLLTADDTPLASRRAPNLPEIRAQNQGFASALESHGSFPRVDHAPFAEPRALVYRKSTRTLLVASEGTNAVVELDARPMDPTMFVKRTYRLAGKPDTLIPVALTGGAPSGLALSADESVAWVYCRTTSDLIELRLDPRPRVAASARDAGPEVEAAPEAGADGAVDAGPAPAAPRMSRLRLADDLLGEPDAKGRRIFYDATDRITSGGVACAGCHPEGRDDGHVWHEARFPTLTGKATCKGLDCVWETANFLADADQAPLESIARVGFPRQTPMLAGRVAASGPYGWHAESPDLVARLKAGFGLHRWGAVELQYGDGELLGRAQYLAPFLRHGLVPPPREVHPLTAEEARGKVIFESNEARCTRCHAPATEYTDRMAYPLSPKLPPPPGFEDEADAQFKTPSLFFVGGTPPYFHDGRAATLEALVEQNRDRMGRTSQLSEGDRGALVAYLRTL